MVVKLSSKGQLVIPKAIRLSLRLRAGDGLRVSRVGRRIILEPVPDPGLIDRLTGRFREADLVASLEADHAREVKRDRRVRP